VSVNVENAKGHRRLEPPQPGVAQRLLVVPEAGRHVEAHGVTSRVVEDRASVHVDGDTALDLSVGGSLVRLQVGHRLGDHRLDLVVGASLFDSHHAPFGFRPSA